MKEPIERIDMKNTVGFRAKIKGLNSQEGKAVMQLVIDPESYGSIPQLFTMVGTIASVEFTSDQLVMFVDKGNGEVIEGQEEAFADEPTYEEPIALPPSAMTVEEDEDEADEGWPYEGDESQAA